MINNNQMSKLSQETRSKIIEEARKYANEKEPNDDYVDNALCSYADGATEWAGRAKNLVEALEEILKSCPDHSGFSKICKNALAKYKEVSNG